MGKFGNIMDGQTKIFDKDEIHIYDKDTVKADYAFSNNDASCKHIWCRLKDKKNIVIDGGGSLLLFHDRITPFLLDGCENICLRNFTIDYDRPFFTQGTILRADAQSVELDIYEEYPYRVEGKNLIIEADEWENDLHDGIMLFQEFDPQTGSLAYDAPVLIYRVGEDAEVDLTAPLPMKILTAEKTENNTLRLYGEFPWHYTVGNELVMTHEKRWNPGIGLTNCKNIRLENIHIIHTGSMGVIAQLSRDIVLDHVKVARGNHAERRISTNCDATHFVACSGKIELTDCTLEHMMDDGVNVHGVYTRVDKKCGGSTVETRLMHFQHFGVEFYRPGDQVNVYCGHTSVTRAKRIVKSVEMTAPDKILLEFTEPAEELQPGDFIENMTATPELYINRLRTGYNRPRGVLPTTPKKVVIENSVFYNSGYGIHIAGDTRFWYESGAVNDVVIRNNRFINCGHDMGNFSIAVTPEYMPVREKSFFHRNIIIENNLFESFLDGMVYACGVKGLKVRNNRFIRTDTYRKRMNTAPVVIYQCSDVESSVQIEEMHEAMV